MRNIVIILSLVLVGLVLVPLDAFAVHEVVFRKQTTVYSKKSKDSDVLTVFEKGEHVPISSKDYGEWRKVVVEIDGKPTAGWIIATDVQDAKLIERTDPFNMDIYHLNKWSIGVLGAFDYSAQGERIVSPVGTPNVDISSLGGTAFFFGIMSDIQLKENFGVRAEILFRKSARTGSGTFVGGSAANIELDQTYLSGVLLAKWYLDKDSNFWYGAGLELAKLTASTLIYSVNGGSNNVTTDGLTMPFFVLVDAGFGYDVHLSKRFFILPTMQLGVMVNAAPIILSFDVLVPVVYTF